MSKSLESLILDVAEEADLTREHIECWFTNYGYDDTYLSCKKCPKLDGCKRAQETLVDIIVRLSKKFKEPMEE